MIISPEHRIFARYPFKEDTLSWHFWKDRLPSWQFWSDDLEFDDNNEIQYRVDIEDLFLVFGNPVKEMVSRIS